MTRTDNHNLFRNPPMPKPEHIRREFSDRTRLRMAIHQFSIRYPRVASQSETQYAEKLGQIMAAKGFGNRIDLAVEVHRTLFQFLHRSKQRVKEEDFEKE